MPKRRTVGKTIATEKQTGLRTAGGNVKTLFTITPQHNDALRDEAFRRATEKGSRKPDASEVLREILDAWIAKMRR